MNSPYSNDSTSQKTADAINKTADYTAQKTADTVNKAADTARNVTDSVLQSTQSAVSATQNAANASMDKAKDTVKQLRDEAEPVISDMAAKAQALAERSINYCAHTGQKLREQMDEYSEATTRYVTQQPGKSVAIAAAAGAALTLATMALMRRRGD